MRTILQTQREATLTATIELIVGNARKLTHPNAQKLTHPLEGWDSFDQPKIADAVSRHFGRPL